MIDLWKGSANTWDCDEMGHMNVRIYLEKAFEGLGLLAGQCHLGHVFRPDGPSTLIPREQHVRFIREVHPGRPLSMTGCVLEVSDTSVLVYQELKHGDGQPAAAIRTQLIHADAHSLKPFAWSRRTREALESLIDTPPQQTAPRGLDPEDPPLPDADVMHSVAADQGVRTIGQGMVPPHHCDVFGRMAASHFIGRISDSVPNLLYDWRKRVADSVPGCEMGAAVLENRMVYRRWPKAGDLFEIRSALGKAEKKIHTLVHWVLDPLTGLPWMTSEALAVTFDLNTRKTIETPPELMQDLARVAPGKLSL